MSAEARREEIVTIAHALFADRGFHGASTEEVARQAGISHAYVFRLFPTKKALFLACGVRCRERIVGAFRDAAASFEAGQSPGCDDVLDAMGMAYAEMLGDRQLLRAQMQFWVTAAADPEVRVAAREQYRAVFEEIERLSGADPDRVRAFVAKGMLLNVSAALSLDEIAGEPWVRRLLPMLEPA
jgi:AcrR family transcriptional regulator